MAELPDSTAKAAAAARRAARLALLCVAIAIAVLLIDNQIKRHIVAKAEEAKAILQEFRVMADGRLAQAERLGDSHGPPAQPDNGVVGPAPGGPAVDETTVPVVDAEAGVRAGGASGPRRDG